jgi:1-phosphofructokinase family hexose kinase
MIVTVALNAALDRTLVAPNFQIGRSRTAERSLSLGGGKGMNVARALFSLGVPVLGLGFAGGLVGAQMRRSLQEEGLPHELIPIAGESRICTAIVDPPTGTATEVNEIGPAIAEDEQQALVAAFHRALPRAMLVALSGSLPPGVPSTFYASLIELARDAGVPCVLDTRGDALRAGVGAAPLLVKPNQSEAAQLLGDTFNPEDGDFVRRAMPRPGPAALCLTLGADGAVLHAPAGSWHAQPSTVRVLDTVGAGDSFVAGLTAALLRAVEQQTHREDTRPIDRAEAAIAQPSVLESMLRLATATAAASTLTLGAGRCDPRDVKRLLPRVAIRAV